VTAADPRGARDFDDLDAFLAQRAGEAGAEAGGALDAGLADRRALPGPRDQRAQAAPAGRERVGSDEAAEQIDDHDGVRVAVGVDAEDDLDGQAWHGGQRRLPSTQWTGRAAIGRDGGQDTQGAWQGS
jgi:hypothetical protein